MSEEATAAPIDLAAEVAVPEGEVSREQLVKILEDSRKSEPTEDAPAVAEPPKAPEPQAEKVSARIIASRRAEMKAQAERQANAAERAAIEKDRAEIAEAKAFKEQIAAATLSPSKLLELAKKSPKEFLEALANEHEPEAVAARAISGTQTEVQKLQARIDAMEAERVAEARAVQWRAMEQEGVQMQAQFLDHVAKSGEKYPNTLEEFTPREIVAKGWELANKHAAAYHAKFGVYPDDEVIADELERQATARAAERRESAWRERIGKSAPIPSQGTSAIQGQPVTAAKPRTLTNGASATNASAPRAELTDAEARAESIRLIEQLHASRGAI